MFLRKLGFAINRLDFWNLEEELTPYELAVHFAAQQIEPIGPDRDDMRAAMAALVAAQVQSGRMPSGDQVEAIGEMMTNYLRLHEQQTISGDEAARRFGAM